VFVMTEFVICNRVSLYVFQNIISKILLIWCRKHYSAIFFVRIQMQSLTQITIPTLFVVVSNVITKEICIFQMNKIKTHKELFHCSKSSGQSTFAHALSHTQN